MHSQIYFNLFWILNLFEKLFLQAYFCVLKLIIFEIRIEIYIWNISFRKTRVSEKKALLQRTHHSIRISELNQLPNCSNKNLCRGEFLNYIRISEFHNYSSFFVITSTLSYILHFGWPAASSASNKERSNKIGDKEPSIFRVSFEWNARIKFLLLI